MLVQSQIDLGTLKGNFALKTYLVCQRNCKLDVICYFEKNHVIFARNLQGQNSSKSVASAAQLNSLQEGDKGGVPITHHVEFLH